MERIEAAIAKLLLSAMPGANPKGLVRCSAEEGVTAYTGEVEAGLLRRKRHDVAGLLEQVRGDEPDLSELLGDLREASRTRPHGPWYRCNVHVDGRAITFEYFWENGPYSSVKELEPDLHGSVPSFVYQRRFDRALVDELADHEVTSCLLPYVPARVGAGKPLTEPLLEVYATLEWQTDVDNGALEQYFAREHEPMTGLPRSSLYLPTHSGLLRVGHTEAAALFAESIALYAHFHPRVEAARREMGIPAVPAQEESDIMERFDVLAQSLEAARVAYVREHVEELEQD